MFRFRPRQRCRGLFISVLNNKNICLYRIKYIHLTKLNIQTMTTAITPIRIKPDLKEKIRQRAEQDGVTMTKVIITALNKYLK